MRTPLIAGNWKLNKTTAEAIEWIEAFKPLVAGHENVEILVCPVAVAIGSLVAATMDANIEIGAQNTYWKDSGAYTGELSPAILKAEGVKYVIVGHSERRGRFGVSEPDLEGEAGRVFGDSDSSVNLKVRALIEHEMTPIICVGETLSERKSGQTDAIVSAQVKAAVKDVDKEKLGALVFAYEPVWAIGTGETCEAEEADRVCGVIRSAVGAQGDESTSEKVRVQYGGSVKPDNAQDLLSRPHIDGALVGGASLKPDVFAEVVRAA